MGRVSKGQRCTVEGCVALAVRSISTEKAGRAGFKIGGARRAYLCEVHYKELKRRLRREQMLEKWRMMGRV